MFIPTALLVSCLATLDSMHLRMSTTHLTDRLPIIQREIGVANTAHSADAHSCASQRAQCRGTRDVVRVQMRFEHVKQLDSKVLHLLQIAPRRFKNWIDDQGRVTSRVGQQAGAGGGLSSKS